MERVFLDLIDEFSDAQQGAAAATEDFVDNVSGLCPNPCQNVPAKSCVLEDIPNGQLLVQMLNFTQQKLAQLLNLPGMREDLLEWAEEFEQLEQTTK